MTYIMGHDDTIQDLSSFHISRLLRGDKAEEEGFWVIRKDFGDDFIDYIS